MISPRWGFFALVSYVPDPLGAHLDSMTQALPSDTFRQAHITILPPRPLRIPVETASDYTRKILDRFKAFEVELSAVRRFPVTGTLYLDLSEGNEMIHRVHDALNTADLAFEEEFEFHPHLTLAASVPGGSIDLMQARAEQLWLEIEPKRRFTVNEIVGLWAEPGAGLLHWHRLWAHPLPLDYSKTAYVGLTGRTS